ncbi:hypothetical protein JZ751_013603 [Albula glossodonta]|uniref:Uncharacterized protein n=1 Tax=Albula glossodonta TaxID=121402 RepID=A0A8T2NTA1_9TELE|nr:hypothetical protein JZ751_013603 [Albula glossodonta]
MPRFRICSECKRVTLPLVKVCLWLQRDHTLKKVWGRGRECGKARGRGCSLQQGDRWTCSCLKNQTPQQPASVTAVTDYLRPLSSLLSDTVLCLSARSPSQQQKTQLPAKGPLQGNLLGNPCDNKQQVRRSKGPPGGRALRKLTMHAHQPKVGKTAVKWLYGKRLLHEETGRLFSDESLQLAVHSSEDSLGTGIPLNRPSAHHVGTLPLAQ